MKRNLEKELIEKHGHDFPKLPGQNDKDWAKRIEWILNSPLMKALS